MRLRPVTEADLDDLAAAHHDPVAMGEYSWEGFSDAAAQRRRFAENGLLGDERSTLIVDVDGVGAGFVGWHPVQVSSHAYVFEFGIMLWPPHRGKGYGSTAQRLLAEYLFDHWPVHRVQAWTEAGNAAEQRALEKAGFVREAVLVEYAFRAGAWRDVVMYRMLRHELPRA